MHILDIIDDGIYCKSSYCVAYFKKLNLHHLIFINVNTSLAATYTRNLCEKHEKYIYEKYLFKIKVLIDLHKAMNIKLSLPNDIKEINTFNFLYMSKTQGLKYMHICVCF